MSLAFIKARIKRKAGAEWRQEIVRRSQGRRAFRIPAEVEIPRMPPGPLQAPKGLASRFFRLASGYAMIAPFLKERFGWVDSDTCWWCRGGRQSREHLLKECRTWKEEIRTLWKEVGEILGSDKKVAGGGVYKGRKGFCIGMNKGVAGPGNTSVKKLLSDGRFVEAVLKFLGNTGVWKVKQGVLLRNGG